MDESRSKTALLVLDMINEKAHPDGRGFEPGVRDILPFIAGELAYFRERLRPIIFCYTPSLHRAYESLDLTEFNNKIINELSPRTQEICIKKTRPNAFFKTDLLATLEKLTAKNLTIVGIFTHTSILTTTSSALDAGFNVVVPEPCVCSYDVKYHVSALSLIASWTKKP